MIYKYCFGRNAWDVRNRIWYRILLFRAFFVFPCENAPVTRFFAFLADCQQMRSDSIIDFISN